MGLVALVLTTTNAFLFSQERMNLAAVNTHLIDFRIRNNKKFFAFEYTLPPLLRIDEKGSKSNECILSKRYTIPFDKGLCVTYTNDPLIVSAWIKTHVVSPRQELQGNKRKDKRLVLGFDVESVPRMPSIQDTAQHDGPATIQISSIDAALVIQLTHRNGRAQTRLLKPLMDPILKDPDVILAGAGIDEDIMELYEFAPSMFANVTSRFDLGGVGAPCQSTRMGLKTLVENLLQLQFEKRRSISVSDWSRVPLSWDQIMYSARDAWAGCACLTALAELDPNQFKFQTIQKLCQTERPVKQLVERAKKRRKAKNDLRVLNQEYSGVDIEIELGGGIFFTNQPYWVHKKRRQLRQVLRDTKPDGMTVFAVRGLTVPNRNVINVELNEASMVKMNDRVQSGKNVTLVS